MKPRGSVAVLPIVILATVGVLTLTRGTAGTATPLSSSENNTSGSSAQPAPPDPADFPPPGPDDSVVRLGEDDLAPGSLSPADRDAALDELLQEERSRRLSLGSRSVADQTASILRSASSISNEQLRAVATFSSPMGLEEYRTRVAPQLPDELLTGDTLVFAYTSLPDGYPITVWGPPDNDFEAQIDGAIDSIARAGGREFDGSPVRVSVLGFSVPVDQFVSREATLRSQYDFAAVEVVANRDTTPMLLE